jgi:AraC-like DNA-binding protein
MSALFRHLYIVSTASGFTLGILIAISLIRRDGMTKRAHQLLGLLFLVCACSVATNAALSLFLIRNYPFLRSLSDPFILLIGPIFLLYIRTISGAPISWKKILVHFAPFVVASVYLVVLASRDQHSFSNPGRLAIINAILGLGIYFHVWVYLSWNRHLLKAYRQRLKQSCSSIEKISQDWISYILATLLVCYTLLGLAYWRSHRDLDLPLNQILAVVVTCIIFVLAYRMLRQPAIFAELANARSVNHSNFVDNRYQKYEKSGLTGNELQRELERVKAFMQREKPYLDPELNLLGLAEKLRMSPHHLSQVINSGSQSNFYDFVNEYRIVEAKKLISDRANNHLTIVGLAFDAGFNSKATFNRFFRKVTGKTPSQFRKES